jgi:hypothetical protein
MKDVVYRTTDTGDVKGKVGGEWSASRPSRFTPGERAPGTHWIGGWVDPRAGLEDVEERKFLIQPGLELQLLGCPSSSQSLYRIRYPGVTGRNRNVCRCCYGCSCTSPPNYKCLHIQANDVTAILFCVYQMWITDKLFKQIFCTLKCVHIFWTHLYKAYAVSANKR